MLTLTPDHTGLIREAKAHLLGLTPDEIVHVCRKALKELQQLTLLKEQCMK